MNDHQSERQNLIPLQQQPTIKQDTDERFSPDRVAEYRTNPERFLETYDQPVHHYNQTSEWGGSDTIATLLNRHDINPENLNVTVFGGFTGEFAGALQDLGCDVVFTDPMAEWTERAKDRGLTTSTCSAEQITGEILARSDTMATFECYYPLQNSVQCVLYTALRFLTTPVGLLFAETPSTRSTRKEQGAKRASLDIYNELQGYIEIEHCYRETNSLRLYRYYQPDNARHQAVILAQILRYLHEYGSDESKTQVDQEIIYELIDKMKSDQTTIIGYLQVLLGIYQDLIGGLAEFIPANQLKICDREFEIAVA